MKNRIATMLLLSGLAFFSGVASAAWNWNLSCGNFACEQTGSESQTSNPVGGPAVNVTGWSGESSGSELTKGYIESWNGVGVQYSGESSTSPDHAMDNAGRYESVLLNFGAEVQLDSVDLGWVFRNSSRRSDFFVLAYTGPASFNGVLVGKSYSSLLAIGSGWALVGNYGGSGQASYALNPGSTYSSFWLIGAGGVSGMSVGRGSNGYFDYMKIAGVSGTPRANTPPGGSVPEPGSLALLGFGLLGMLGLSRRGTA